MERERNERNERKGSFLGVGAGRCTAVEMET